MERSHAWKSITAWQCVRVCQGRGNGSEAGHAHNMELGNASMLCVLHTHLHPYYLNCRLHPSVYCMLQRAPAEQKALTYKKEGACFKATVCIHPNRVLQSVSRFRGNGCTPLLGKASSLSLVGSPLTQHGVGGTAISLLTESKGCKTPTAVSLTHFSGRRQGRVVSCLTLEGIFPGPGAVGHGRRRWVCIWGEHIVPSGLLRGQTQPLFHSDLRVGVPSSRHRADPFTSLHEFPFIPEVLGLVSWFCSFDTCIPHPCSAGVKWPIYLYVDSAAVIYTS